ncbi:MAG: efflux RND transporter permease subunit, partial [Saprospiraceae bacterium]
IGSRQANWDKAMLWIYDFTKIKVRQIVWIALASLVISAWGISMITTNYEVINNLPSDGKITQDFRFFERELSGFRPMEFAGYIQNDYQANDFVVVKEIDKLETYLRQFPEIQAIGSVTAVYKTLNQMFGNNNPNAYRLPEDEDRFNQYRRLADKIPQLDMNVLVSKDGTKARVTSRVKDIGADSIKQLGQRIERWIKANINPDVIRFKLTGTGLLIDKNAEYVRRNLLQGVGFAILLIGGLMALLFLNLRMLLISLVPNLFPLIFGAAFLGFVGVELEAGISIIFSVIFGIAVDDSIHFLSKFKLAQQKGLDREAALRITFLEAGKPIVLTTVLLFFGFLVMLFSSSPTTATVGWLISITLVTALICDLFMLPVLIRWFLKE